MLITRASFFFDHWLFHPLRGLGYQFWSGVEGDITQLGIIVGLITSAIALHRFLHRHFPCHAEGCKRLGFHHVAGTPHRTCWPHHPVLGQHERGRVPHEIILARHHAANGPTADSEPAPKPCGATRQSET